MQELIWKDEIEVTAAEGKKLYDKKRTDAKQEQ
jgi:hypothetical protein